MNSLWESYRYKYVSMYFFQKIKNTLSYNHSTVLLKDPIQDHKSP